MKFGSGSKSLFKSISGDFHLCVHLSVFIISSIFVHFWFIIFMNDLIFNLFCFFIRWFHLTPFTTRKWYQIFNHVGFLYIYCHFFYFSIEFFLVILKYFVASKEFGLFFNISRYAGPLVGFFASDFLLLSESYQLMLTHFLKKIFLLSLSINTLIPLLISSCLFHLFILLFFFYILIFHLGC